VLFEGVMSMRTPALVFIGWLLVGVSVAFER
jgi:hypothetical protein